MKKILIISYLFPPCGSSATARNLGFAKHLRELGSSTTVLTVKEDTFTKIPGTRLDDSYKNEMEGISIERTSSFIPAWFLKLLYKLHLSRLIKLFFPLGIELPWMLPATLRALKILKREKYDLILSTSLPYTSHFIAMLSVFFRKVPWIADFADPMGYKFNNIWLTRLNYWLILFLEKRICKKATGITVQSNGAKKILLEKHKDLDENKIIPITCAFDGRIMTSQTKNLNRDKFQILHSGEFYGHYTKKASTISTIKKALTFPIRILEYSPVKSDRSSHSLEPLLRALRSVLNEKPELSSKIELKLNGLIHPMDKELIKELSLESIVEITGLTSYSESLKFINSADLLYLPLYIDLGREENDCIPGKLFPYLASLNPVLAPIQKGNAKEILEKSRSGIFCEPLNIEAMKNSILMIFEHFSCDKQFLIPDIDYINKFSRFEQNKRLFTFIENVLANKSQR